MALSVAAADLIVDGLVGIGARGALRGAAADAVEALTAIRTTEDLAPIVVSVDVPSGVDVDSGAVEGRRCGPT